MSFITSRKTFVIYNISCYSTLFGIPSKFV